MKRTVLFLLTFFSLHIVLLAQGNKRQVGFNVIGKYIAMQGYDPVGYFDQNKAIVGKATHAVVHDGITYYFSSPQNKAAFLIQPQKYEPQYGGWCAYAMGATGEKVSVDSATFKIINGKLFLFYNRFFNNTLKSWNKSEKSLNIKADANWSKIFN